MLKTIVAGLEMSGRIAGVLAGVDLGRRAYAAAVGAADPDVEAEQVNGHEEVSGYPLAFRLDPLHVLTPTPAEWELKRAMRAQGAAPDEIKATIKAGRERARALKRAGPEAAQAVASATRDEAEAWETQRKRAALAAAQAGDARRARAEARAAILSRRFRKLSAMLSQRGAEETDPERAQAMAAQAAATAELAKAPPTPADVPTSRDPLSSHVRALVSAIASKAGDRIDALADRIQAGTLAQTEDEDEYADELTPEEALAIVAGEDVEGEPVEGCGCGVAGSAAPVTTTLAGVSDPEDRGALLAAFQAMAEETAGPEAAPAVPRHGLVASLAAWAGVSHEDEEPIAGAPPEGEPGAWDELFRFQAAPARPRRVASVPPKPRGGCSSGSCPV